jgi:hypothetical protein
MGDGVMPGRCRVLALFGHDEAVVICPVLGMSGLRSDAGRSLKLTRKSGSCRLLNHLGHLTAWTWAENCLRLSEAG